jgi:hypothetical protein
MALVVYFRAGTAVQSVADFKYVMTIIHQLEFSVAQKLAGQ